MNSRITKLLVQWLAVILIVSCSTSGAFAQIKPVVVSTDPANGQTGVSRYLASFSITFSKPMSTASCGANTNNWTSGGPGTSCIWSADTKTMTVSRQTPVTPLVSLTTVVVSLNPAGQPAYLKDSEGLFLDPYSFTFRIEDRPSPTKIASNPQAGFWWPYYLYIPIETKSPPVLMVEPNNTGTVSDDPVVHDRAALSLMNSKRQWADDWGVPYLVPAFPRPASDPTMYTHALDLKTIQSTTPGLVRIDLQLIAMIKDAQAYLGAKGIVVDSKVFMLGVSASGSFVSRFVMLHPDIVKAASVGAPGFGPIVPVAQWNGQALPYPEGIGNLEALVGHSFDADTFRTVPLQVWVGDEDRNVGPYWLPSDPTVARVSAAFGGLYLYQRWPRYEAAYYAVGSPSQFVVFPGMGHSWATEAYLGEFFERNRLGPMPPLPRPMLYKLYFPHIASFPPWQTEIAILNTVPGGAPIHGKLQTYRAQGGDPLQTMDIVLQPGERKEITVGGSFQNPGAIAYIALASDSGFLTGYTRFAEPGGRVSLITGTGATQAWFTKVETDGWTGIAFVNVDSQMATVNLTAWNDQGSQVGTATLTLAPGQKYVALVSELFRFDAVRTTYIKYVSNKKLVGFSVSGSGLMLDGLHSLGPYIPQP